MRRRGPASPSPLQSHDHEWRLVEEAPILEDGAAIFREECNWVEITGSAHSEKHDETFYETGAECDEYRTYRFEESSIIRKRDDAPNVEFILDSEEPPAERGPDWLLPHLIEAQQQGKITDVDPEKVGGRVVAETDGWKVIYEP